MPYKSELRQKDSSVVYGPVSPPFVLLMAFLLTRQLRLASSAWFYIQLVK